MGTTDSKMTYRWIAFITVLTNIIFNYLFNYFPLLTKAIMNEYHALFIPADYALTIRGLIFFSFIIYSIYQLLPAQRNKTLYDDLAIPLIFINALDISWSFAFSHQYIGISVVVILIMLNVSLEIFRILKRKRNKHLYSSWINFPFSVYLGWITITNIATIDMWFTSMDWQRWALGETGWKVILILSMFLSAIIICLYYRDSLYPLVISCALLSIWGMDKFTNEKVAVTALVAGIILLIVSIYYMIKNYFYQKRPLRYTGSCVMKIVR